MLKEFFFPNLRAILNERKIKKNIENVKPIHVGKFEHLGYTAIEKENVKLLEMRRALEEKAKATTIAVTVGIIFAAGALTQLANLPKCTPQIFKIGFALLGSMIIVYLVSAGLSALSALKLRMTFGVFLNDLLLSENEKKTEIAIATVKNQYTNIIVANYTYAAYYSLAKALIVFVMFFIYSAAGQVMQ